MAFSLVFMYVLILTYISYKYAAEAHKFHLYLRWNNTVYNNTGKNNTVRWDCIYRDFWPRSFYSMSLSICIFCTLQSVLPSYFSLALNLTELLRLLSSLFPCNQHTVNKAVFTQCEFSYENRLVRTTTCESRPVWTLDMHGRLCHSLVSHRLE